MRGGRLLSEMRQPAVCPPYNPPIAPEGLWANAGLQIDRAATQGLDKAAMSIEWERKDKRWGADQKDRVNYLA